MFGGFFLVVVVWIKKKNYGVGGYTNKTVAKKQQRKRLKIPR